VTVGIKRAGIDDAPIVHRIMLAAFAEYIGVLQPPSGSTSESLQDVERVMREGGAVIAWEAETPVGTARYQVYPDHLYAGRVAVLPSHRGRGIGSAMMRYMDEIAREIGLNRVTVGIRMSLPRNLSFYRRLGYKIEEVEPHPRGPDMVATLVKRL
jgi:ribosomal protein S18 acetylase RimI-like enzyme